MMVKFLNLVDLIKSKGAEIIIVDPKEESLSGFLRLLNLDMQADLPLYFENFSSKNIYFNGVQSIIDFNNACSSNKPFDPTSLDGKKTSGLALPKSNWAQTISEPPFRAYPVTGGITFTYGGLKISENGSVLDEDENPILGLYACGELVGGVFYNGYPGGSGLTSGLVFGRIAGLGASQYLHQRHQVK